MKSRAKLVYWIQNIWNIVEGVVSELPQYIASLFTDDGTNVGGTLTYSSPVPSAEASQLPEARECVVSGTLQVGELLTITFKVRNNSSQADGAHQLKLYRADNINGGNETLVSTLSGGSQLGDTVTFTYTLLVGQTGYFIMFEPVPKLADGTTIGTNVERSNYSDTVVVAASSIYDYFNVGWADDTTMPADWNSNPAAVWASRAGAWGAGAKGAGFPDLVDSTTDYLDFIQGNSDFMSRILGGVAMSLGFEFWFEVQSMAISSTHCVLTWSGTGSIRSVSGNIQLRLGGTAATLFPASAINGHYLVRIQCNGGVAGNKVWIKQKGAVGYLVSAGPQYNVATDVGSTVPTASITMYLGAGASGAGPYCTMRVSGWGIKSAAGLDADAQLIFNDF